MKEELFVKSNYQYIIELKKQVKDLQNQVNDLMITVNRINKVIIEGDKDV